VVASIALGKIGKPAVLPLVRAFRAEDGIVRPKIVSILADIGDPALEEMAGALRDPDEEVRALSALALGEMRSPRAIDHLIVALRDGSPRVRAQAAISLGELGAPGAEEALARAAETDENEAVRQVAGNALIRVRSVREDRAASHRDGAGPG
jgi:bilin biosynthesis protein